MQRSFLQEWRISTVLLATLTTFVVFCSPGCDPTVDVFRPSDRLQYSVYGALNVAADTQVIRVDPIDDTIQIGAPPDLDAAVRLSNLDTGEQVSLHDSLTRIGIQNAQVHNFWTTHPIQPATSYRVTVRDQGETAATATTTTPPRPPTLEHDDAFLLPCVFPRRFEDDEKAAENTFTVTIRNVERVAAANVIYPIMYSQGDTTLRTRREFSHYEDVQDKGSFFEVPIFYRPELVRINPVPEPMVTCTNRSNFTHPYALVAVASGGPDWPERWRGLPLDRIADPSSFSNVQGGHGFVGGVYSDTIEVPIRRRPPPF